MNLINWFVTFDGVKLESFQYKFIETHIF